MSSYASVVRDKPEPHVTEDLVTTLKQPLVAPPSYDGIINLSDPIYRVVDAQAPSAPEAPRFSAKARKQQASHAGVKRNDDTAVSDLGLDVYEFPAAVVSDSSPRGANNICGNRTCSRSKPCRKCRRKRLRKPALPKQQHSDGASPTGRAVQPVRDAHEVHPPKAKRQQPVPQRVDAAHSQQHAKQAHHKRQTGAGSVQRSNGVCAQSDVRRGVCQVRQVSDGASSSSDSEQEQTLCPYCGHEVQPTGGDVFQECGHPSRLPAYGSDANDNSGAIGPVLTRMPCAWNPGKLPSTFDTNVDYHAHVGALSNHISDRNHAGILSKSRMARDGATYRFGDGLADFYDAKLMNHLQSVMPYSVFVPVGDTKRNVVSVYLFKEMEKYYRGRKEWSGQTDDRGQEVIIPTVVRNRRINTVRLAVDSVDMSFLMTQRPPDDRWRGGRWWTRALPSIFRGVFRGVRSFLRALFVPCSGLNAQYERTHSITEAKFQDFLTTVQVGSLSPQ
jgi:hypothetical protein